jgi:hypothetical protein
MNTCKLIKEYPGSSKLGNIEKISDSMLEKYSEFFEVIQKDYEVAQVLYATEIRTLFDGKYIIFTDGVGFDLDYILNNGGKIHSVNRMSDGERFTVGDRIDIGTDYPVIRTISMINISSDGTLVIDHEHGGLTNKIKGTFHRIKQAPLNYEILSYVKKGSTTCYTTKRRGGERHEEFWDIRVVKRLCDGEVFTVGDTIDFNGKGTGKLLKIEFESAPADKGTGKLSFVNDGTNLGKWWSINELIKIKKPIFTTEDGVDVYFGDRFWFTEKFDNTIFNTTAIDTSGKSPSSKYFSTEEAAENYILKYKICLSVDDIQKAIHLPPMLFEKLLAAAKSKLNHE